MIRIALVVAVAENGVIGSGGGLAWRISDDLKWFKKVTLGKPIVMGRKTFDSIGRALPGRANIVVTRSAFMREGAAAATSVDEALRFAEEAAKEAGADEICIIGGGEIYRQTLARADRIYLTRVEARIAGDTFFPRLEPAEWRETAAGGCAQSEKNEHSCRFFILDRAVLQRNRGKASEAKAS